MVRAPNHWLLVEARFPLYWVHRVFASNSCLEVQVATCRTGTDLAGFEEVRVGKGDTLPTNIELGKTVCVVLKGPFGFTGSQKEGGNHPDENMFVAPFRRQVHSKL